MRRIIFALFTGILLSSAAIAVAQTKPLELAADAPDRYVVLPGDTLWSLSSKFLKDPYRRFDLVNHLVQCGNGILCGGIAGFLALEIGSRRDEPG